LQSQCDLVDVLGSSQWIDALLFLEQDVQTHSRHILHDEKMSSLVLSCIVSLDDSGVGYACKCPGFPLKTRDGPSIAKEMGSHDFDSDRPFELHIEGLVHGAH